MLGSYWLGEKAICNPVTWGTFVSESIKWLLKIYLALFTLTSVVLYLDKGIYLFFNKYWK